MRARELRCRLKKIAKKLPCESVVERLAESMDRLTEFELTKFTTPPRRVVRVAPRHRIGRGGAIWTRQQQPPRDVLAQGCIFKRRKSLGRKRYWRITRGEKINNNNAKNRRRERMRGKFATVAISSSVNDDEDVQIVIERLLTGVSRRVQFM